MQPARVSKSIDGGWREERKRAGLTQAQLAERAGLSPRTVATAEAGGAVSTRTVALLRAALARTPAPPLRQDAIVAPTPMPGTPPVETRVIEVEGKTLRIDTRRYQDLPVVSVTRWDTVAAVRGALADFERGQFAAASEIVEAMMADDRIKGVTSQRIDGLLGLPFALSPAEDDDDFAAELAEAVEDLWPRIIPEEALRDLWKWGRYLGIGVGEKLYDTAAPEGWVPTVKVWHPRYVYWRWDTRSYWLNTQDGPVELREGDPHWVLYTPYGYYRGWMEALIRSLAIPWLFRQFSYREWGRYNEVHGIPIRGILEPADWDDEDKKKALREVAMLASESIIRLPQRNGSGFDLKLIEASAQTYDAFRLALEAANSSIAIVILGQNLTTEVKGGAYSAAQVHERVAAAIIRSDSKTLSRTLRKQVLVEWAALNHGPEAAEVAPTPSWDTDPPEDKGAKATALKTTADAFASLRSSQLPVDFHELAEQHGIPLVEGAEIPEYQPSQPPPGFGPPDQEKQGRAQNARARLAARATREVLAKGQLRRRHRAPFQGQAYVDELAENGRDEAARVLAGDVRALKQVLANAKPGPDGKVDGPAIKAALLEAYRDMREDQLAGVLAKCRLLAELSGRYAVLKEVTSE